MQLTISIVNWNVRDYLERCLDSIFKYSAGLDFEVIVVDNASKDDSANMVRRKFPQVKLIENAENIGYGWAHNQVIPIALGRYILFLNPDTEMLHNTLSKMLKFMEMHPEAGACACKQVQSKEEATETIFLTKYERLLWFFYKRIYQIFPNPITKHCYIKLVTKAIISSRNRYIYFRVERLGLEGGFFLCRKEALNQTGGFNPKFFFGGEGNDLSERLRKLGWKLYYVNTVKVIHYSRKSRFQLSDVEMLELEENWEKRISLHK